MPVRYTIHTKSYKHYIYFYFYMIKDVRIVYMLMDFNDTLMGLKLVF